MKSNIKSVVTLELTGEEYKDLCSIIDAGRYHLEDLNEACATEEKADVNLINSRARLIEISKLYTNLRVQL